LKLVLALMLAHSFYSPSCCSDKDCRPVPCEEMKIVKRGENEIAFWHGLKFLEVKTAPDGGCHVCTGTSTGTEFPICAYKPMPLS
jgi:hypothetical protein